MTSDTIALLQPTAGEVVPSYLPTLGWSNSERSVFYYEIQMSKDPAFSPEEFLHNELVHGGVSMPRNTYRVPQAFPLEPASTYYWRVRPRIQGDGIPLPWTAAASFQTR